MERPWNRRRREREHVDLEPQRPKQLLLRHPETLLLVQDHEPEILRDDVAREDPVRPDEDVDLSLAEVGQDPRLLGAAAEARDHLDADGKVAVPLAKGVPVLLREDRSGAEDERLAVVERDRECRTNRDLGLPEADVAADEAIHRPARFQVFLHGLDRLLLILGLAVRERALQPFEPVVREVECEPRRLTALRVEGEELARELAHGGTRAALEVLPGLPAELRQDGRPRVRADVARDLRDLLVRDVESIVASESEEQIVARDAGDVFRLEPEETPDAVILVDDVVADPQVRERLQRPPEPRIHAWRSLPEDLRVREERNPEVARDEAPAGGTDDERDRRRLPPQVDLLTDGRIDLPEQSLRAQRLALVRERHDHAALLAHHARELVFRLREAARRDRGALRLEDVWLRARQRVESRRPAEVGWVEFLLLPDADDVVDLPDEIGRRGQERRIVLRRVFERSSCATRSAAG